MRVVLIALTLFASSFAATAEEKLDCKNAMTQAAMNECAALDFEAADKKLNEVWPGLKADTKQQDTDEGEGKTEYLDALMASQRAWIAYRDAECQRYSNEAKGGSMQPLLLYGCMATMTEKRIKELQSNLEDEGSSQ
jgi:uncharacterized protein YecT (DUF1311 family)